MTIVMIRSGGLGLLGWVGRRTANAFEAKIDNTIIAMAKDLFAFIRDIHPALIGFYETSGGFSDAAKGEMATPPFGANRLRLDSAAAGE
jgi:hypothetical protein